MATSSLDGLVTDILTHTLSLQQGIDAVRTNPAAHRHQLRTLVTSHASGIIRLWAVWALAEIQDRDSLALLKKAYFTETNPETRVNIVWALFVVDARHITLPLLRSFLNDSHFAVPMLCVRYIRGLHWLEHKINLVQTYKTTQNRAVRAELLKNIRSFAYDHTTINTFLAAELTLPYDTSYKATLLSAITASNQISSADILLDYYHNRRHEFHTNEQLALQLAESAHHLGRAKLYHALHDVYYAHQNPTIRDKIRETLLSGGSCCYDLLRKIDERQYLPATV